MPSALGDHVVGKDIRCELLTTKSLEADEIFIRSNTIESMISANTNVQADFQETDATKDSYIKNKPVIVDWTTDQLDTDINANNIPALPYASQNIASNGVAGLTHFNFNLARKNKLTNIEDYAQVNIKSDWNEIDSSKDSFIQNKPLFQTPLTFSNASIGSGSGNIQKTGNTVTYTPPLLSGKQDKLTIINNSTSNLNGVTYPNGGLDLTTGTLTYIPPDADLTPAWVPSTNPFYAPLASPNLTGTPKVNNNEIKVSVGDGALTEKNFTITLKDKLDLISDNADVTPAWVPSTDPFYAPLTSPNFSGTPQIGGVAIATTNDLSNKQNALDSIVIASPSGAGNLTLTSNTGYNTQLTYTPPVIPTVIPTNVTLPQHGDLLSYDSSTGSWKNVVYVAPPVVYYAASKQYNSNGISPNQGPVVVTGFNPATYMAHPQFQNSFNRTLGEFTAPVAGMYQINYTANIHDGQQPHLDGVGSVLQMNSGSGWFNYKYNYTSFIPVSANVPTNYTTLNNQRTAHMDGLHYLAVGWKIRHAVDVYSYVGSSDLYDIRGDNTLPRFTYQSVHLVHRT